MKKFLGLLLALSQTTRLRGSPFFVIATVSPLLDAELLNS